MQYLETFSLFLFLSLSLSLFLVVYNFICDSCNTISTLPYYNYPLYIFQRTVHIQIQIFFIDCTFFIDSAVCDMKHSVPTGTEFKRLPLIIIYLLFANRSFVQPPFCCFSITIIFLFIQFQHLLVFVFH